MHKALLLTSLLFLFACGGGADGTPGGNSTPTAAPEPGQESTGTAVRTGDALTGSGLRFDGVYQVVLGERIVYLVRFFPEGHAVLVAGPNDTRDQLATRLVPNALTEAEIGLYNVPVTLRNDSILFETKAVKGLIDYACVLQGSDTLRVLKHSHVNGKRALLDYLFAADA